MVIIGNSAAAIDGPSRALAEALELYRAPEGSAEALGEYARLLRRSRGWAGLISSSMAEAQEAPMGQSLTLLEAIENERLEVVDVGSGGGLMGIPIAVARPGWTVTLLERSGRKCAFLAEAIGLLDLENTTVLRGDAAAFAGMEFDLAMSRASGGIVDMSRVVMPLLSRSGRYVALRGDAAREEAEQARDRLAVLGARLVGVREAGVTLEPELRRTSLVVIEKL
ncbi:MAG: 16S rRNA (guanine(527)-N(7))-methyltransferase RsmG [Actinobacteria bacterium]|nr:16S rRNA (guanine(527)-N(7))-methyltransferase RsmG [Actinomycetota bacterium]